MNLYIGLVLRFMTDSVFTWSFIDLFMTHSVSKGCNHIRIFGIKSMSVSCRPCLEATKLPIHSAPLTISLSVKWAGMECFPMLCMCVCVCVCVYVCICGQEFEFQLGEVTFEYEDSYILLSLLGCSQKCGVQVS